jgi:replicative DNA helicase
VSTPDTYDDTLDGGPRDLAAERSTLGGMLLSADAVAQVADILRPRDFYDPRHPIIFGAIVHLHTEGEPTDAVAVGAELVRRGVDRQAGGAPYLHTLIHEVPTATNADYYADLVAKCARRRRLLQAGTRITQLAAIGDADDVQRLVDRAQAELDDVGADQATDSGHVLFADLRATELSALDDVQAGRVAPGLPTGFADLDSVTNGLKGGQFIVIAARPGIGKSSLGTDFARYTAFTSKLPVAMYSLEMPRSELWRRIVAAQAGVRLLDLNTPHRLTLDDFERVSRKLKDIEEHGAPLVIDDTPTQTVHHIRNSARRIKARHGLNLIVVDYLQLLTPTRRAETRQLEVSEFSRMLKVLALELDVPVVAISQLNRGPEQRADKRPQIGDLRESGALEQDSDMVILINRPDYYERDCPRAGEADFILAKNRGGPTATITVAQQLHIARFADLARA